MMEKFLLGVLIIMGIFCFLCLLRAVLGPRPADRIVAVNMLGTLVTGMIAVLGVMLHEGYLADICVIYTALSFLAVIVFAKVYIGAHKEKEEKEAW